MLLYTRYKKACDIMTKRKDQKEQTSSRGGRGGAVSRGPVKQIGKSYQQTLQTVS